MICVGLPSWPTIPSSASATQTSFGINRVAMSVIATYSNSRIVNIEVIGTIQLIHTCPYIRGRPLRPALVGDLKLRQQLKQSTCLLAARRASLFWRAIRLWPKFQLKKKKTVGPSQLVNVE